MAAFRFLAAIGAAIGLLCGGLWASSPKNSPEALWWALSGAAIDSFIGGAAMEPGKDKNQNHEQLISTEQSPQKTCLPGFQPGDRL